MTKTLHELLQPGSLLRYYWNEGNRNNYAFEVRAIVDDDYIVTRMWSYSSRSWRYSVDHRVWFELAYERDALKPRSWKPSGLLGTAVEK